MQVDANMNTMTKIIVHSDLSDKDSITVTEDMVEAETAVQSPN